MSLAGSLAKSWPSGHPKILITDAWLANAGDAALAIATETLVRQCAPEAAILHAAYHGAELGPRLPELRFTAPLDQLIGSVWAAPAEGWEEVGPTLVAGADAVISQGGGFLIEAYQPWSRIASLAAVTRQGVPLALLGQTIDSFVRPPDGDLHQVMRDAALVVVRDGPSVAHATDLGACDVVLGTDLSLGLFPDPPTQHERRGIAVVLSDHHPERDRRARLATVAHRVAEATLAASPGESLTFWSTVQGHPELASEDDAILAAAVFASLSPAQRARVELVKGYVSPDKAIVLVRQSRALVSMRMHPALFAAALDTPFTLVLGGQKVEVLAGSHLRDRIVDPSAATAVLAGAVARSVGSGGGSGQWMALDPLRIRLDEVRSRLADFLAGLPGTARGEARPDQGGSESIGSRAIGELS